MQPTRKAVLLRLLQGTELLLKLRALLTPASLSDTRITNESPAVTIQLATWAANPRRQFIKQQQKKLLQVAVAKTPHCPRAGQQQTQQGLHVLSLTCDRTTPAAVWSLYLPGGGEGPQALKGALRSGFCARAQYEHFLSWHGGKLFPNPLTPGDRKPLCPVTQPHYKCWAKS